MQTRFTACRLSRLSLKPRACCPKGPRLPWEFGDAVDTVRRGAREPWIAAMTALSCFVARVVIVSVSQSRIVTSKHWTLD